MIYQPIPEKYCPKCNRWLLCSTIDFAARRGKKRIGLRTHCKECARAYNHRYYHADPQKQVARVCAYLKKHPEKKREHDKRHRQRHREQHNANNRKEYQRHRERYSERSRLANLAHPEKKKVSERRWRQTNPEKARAKTQRHRAAKRLLPSCFTDADWERALAFFQGACAYCGHPPMLWDNPRVLQQDHFIPASLGGGYTPDNILPACPFCNKSKSDNEPNEWIKKRFGKRKASLITKRITAYFASLCAVNH